MPLNLRQPEKSANMCVRYILYKVEIETMQVIFLSAVCNTNVIWHAYIYQCLYTLFFTGPLLAIAAAVEVSGKSFSDVWTGIISQFSHREHMNPLRGNSDSILLAGITSLYILLSVYSACAPIYKTYLGYAE